LEQLMQKRFRASSSQSGETLAEYVLMLALIFVIVAAASIMIGDRASSVFNHTSEQLLKFLR